MACYNNIFRYYIKLQYFLLAIEYVLIISLNTNEASVSADWWDMSACVWYTSELVLYACPFLCYTNISLLTLLGGDLWLWASSVTKMVSSCARWNMWPVATVGTRVDWSHWSLATVTSVSICVLFPSIQNCFITWFSVSELKSIHRSTIFCQQVGNIICDNNK